MATMTGIVAAMRTVTTAFPTFSPNDEFLKLLSDSIASATDEDVAEAARRLAIASTSKPTLADIRRETLMVEADRVRKETWRNGADAEGRPIIYYHQRSAEERAEIDRERNRCLAVIRGLCNGDDLSKWFAPDSEVMRLSAEMDARRAERGLPPLGCGGVFCDNSEAARPIKRDPVFSGDGRESVARDVLADVDLTGEW
jgi:hypothetical protein